MVGAAGGDPQIQLARFDDAAAVAAGEGGQVGGQLEADPAALPRFERDAKVADRAPDRPDHRGHRIVQVELHDLAAGPLAGVAELEGHAEAGVGTASAIVSNSLPNIVVDLGVRWTSVRGREDIDRPYPSGV